MIDNFEDSLHFTSEQTSGQIKPKNVKVDGALSNFLLSSAWILKSLLTKHLVVDGTDYMLE